MKPLNCSEAARHLDDYLDRELGEQDLAAVEAHLAACEHCTGHFDLEREVVERIRARLRQLKAPPGLLERIMSSLEGQP